jgi:hypothetical protein
VRIALALIAGVCLASGCANSEVSAVGQTTGTSSPPTSNCDEDDYPGPWTACPDFDWVRGIVEATGYEMADFTGSALVARGRGDSFYIWATKGHGSLAGASRLGCRIGDAKVWVGKGGMDDWRYWQAQGYTFWLSAGPLMTSRSPDPCELEALVQASRSMPPPSAGP